eukprot:SM000134S26927  [mRNA]  locus=s134:4170:7181:- [translate_table: standard]
MLPLIAQYVSVPHSPQCVAFSAASGPRRIGGVPTVYHPAYSAPQLPPGHRFPMAVFRAIYEELLSTGLTHLDEVHMPQSMPTLAQMCLVHERQYIEDFCNGRLSRACMKRIGLEWTPVLVERTLIEVAGTLLTAELALEHGLACNTAGGTHHAHRDFGSGFCIINDLAVAAAVLLERGEVDRVLILDLDVHQGDGTAAILAGEPRVFTLSMHCGANFPTRKQVSDLDVDIPVGTGDEEYLRLVAHHLPQVLSLFRPNLVLYDAGVDPHKDDTLGRLSLTSEGLHQRELQVLDTCLGSGIPVAGFVGGGYHEDISVRGLSCAGS